MDIMKIENVSKNYAQDKPFAVKNLSLEIKEGEIFGFLGPNGAGKSTTIKMMVGMLAQDSGSITICGHDTLKESMDVKKLIGFVPDEPLFYEKMTAIRYLNFICDLFEVSAADRKERIEHYSKLFEIYENLNDEISSFSHGMKQKLGVIAALSHKPKFFILDEPMVGLDPKSSFTLKEIMREYCKSGSSVFFSTHVMDTAERLCDRVGIINKGSLVYCGTFEDLKKSTGEKNATLEQLFLELTGASELEIEEKL